MLTFISGWKPEAYPFTLIRTNTPFQLSVPDGKGCCENVFLYDGCDILATFHYSRASVSFPAWHTHSGIPVRVALVLLRVRQMITSAVPFRNDGRIPLLS